MVDNERLVLLVEDEPAMSGMLRRVLVAGGYDVARASTGREAIDLFGSAKPAIVLSDIRLPDLDGHEFLSEIRLQYPEQTWTPVVMMTAFHDQATRLKSLKLRADGFLEKPIDHMILIATLRNRLERAAELRRTARLALDALDAAS
ncbi:MAG: response regulator [Alphaproteobacteria bacterium]|nr:response regulator [Alphaproteobacteria bacterium]